MKPMLTDHSQFMLLICSTAERTGPARATQDLQALVGTLEA